MSTVDTAAAAPTHRSGDRHDWTLGILTAAGAALPVGRWLDRHGGRGTGPGQ